MKSIYNVTVLTKVKYAPEEYEAEAEHLISLFTKLLTDTEHIHTLLHTDDFTSFHSELVIAHDRTGLVGKCTITIDAPGRVQLDKGRLSSFMKSNSFNEVHGDWPQMRVEKKGTFTDD